MVSSSPAAARQRTLFSLVVFMPVPPACVSKRRSIPRRRHGERERPGAAANPRCRQLCPAAAGRRRACRRCGRRIVERHPAAPPAARCPAFHSSRPARRGGCAHAVSSKNRRRHLAGGAHPRGGSCRPAVCAACTLCRSRGRATPDCRRRVHRWWRGLQ